MSEVEVQRESVWSHSVSGRKFFVVAESARELPDSHPARKDSFSEEFVFCAVDSFEEYPYVMLARRLFESQLDMVSEDGDAANFH